MKKTKANSEKLLTDVELELMNILWRMGEGSVADVQEHLPKNRDLAYTSVSTILRILEQKEILKTRKEGRGHIYIPEMTKRDYEARAVKQVVEKVFDGAPSVLVKQLLEAGHLTKSEIEEIRFLLSKEIGK